MLRQLKFTGLGAVAIIAVGVALSMAAFAVLYAVLLEPLPFPDAERVAYLSGGHRDGEAQMRVAPVSLFVARELANRTEVIESWTAIDEWTPVIETADGPVSLPGASVTSGYFEVFGLNPHLGRFFVPSEDAAGHEDVVVITHSAWQSHFGADADVIGRSVSFNGVPYVVVGVMPAEWEDPRPMNLRRAAQVFRVSPSYFASHPPDAYSVAVVARISQGIGLDRARSDIAAAFSGIRMDHPGTFDSRADPDLVPLLTAMTGASMRTLPLAFGAALMVLLIGAFNVANLALVRMLDRARDISIRRALGAGNSRIRMELLLEQAMIAVTGGVTGAFLGWALLEFIRTQNLLTLPRLETVGVSVESVIVAIAGALLVGIGAGMLAVRHALRISPNGLLGETGRSAGPGAGAQRARRVLVVGEVAVATVLVIVAVMLGSSFKSLQQTDLGIDAEGTLVTGVQLSYVDFPIGRGAEQLVGFWNAAVSSIAGLPGVVASGAISIPPLSAGFSCEAFRRAEDAPPSPGEVRPCMEARVIAGDYFAATGMPVLSGRTFDPERDVAGRESVVIISRSAAERHWPGESVIGRRVEIWGEQRTIVGTVGDVLHSGPTATPQATAYFPHSQVPQRFMTAYVRAAGDPAALVEPVRHVLRELSPGTPLVDTRLFQDFVADALRAPRAAATLITLFSFAGLLLALSGIAAVFFYIVACRRTEFGVRLALGSSKSGLTRLVLREAGTLVAIGAAIGCVFSVAAVRALSGLVHGIDVHNPVFIIAGLSVLTVGALAAATAPAWRAAHTAPAEALRG